MTRIVISPTDLAQTASLLHDAAGEYYVIGARVASCDCGCMPPDVAGTVDAVAAGVRTGLVSISGELEQEAAVLTRRSEVGQNGGFSAVGAAWGDGVVSVEGSVPDEFAGLNPGANTMTVGSAVDAFALGGQQIVAVSGGGDIWGGVGTTARTTSVGGGAEDIWGGIGLSRQTLSVGGGDGDIFSFGNQQSVSVGDNGDIFGSGNQQTISVGGDDTPTLPGGGGGRVRGPAEFESIGLLMPSQAEQLRHLDELAMAVRMQDQLRQEMVARDPAAAEIFDRVARNIGTGGG
jgi:hypothetical protein